MSEQQEPRSFPPQHQEQQPGRQTEMTPRPQEKRPAYQGSNKLSGKVALITGGDSGIGRAVAIAFAKEGADVAIVYLNEHEDAEESKRQVEQEGRRCLTIAGDVGEDAFCRQAVERTVQELGKLDLLVNNAGEQHPQQSIEDITAEQFERTFRTNIFGYFFMAKAALRHIPEGGAIVNTTSVTAYKGSLQLLDYSATKGAVVAFTRSLSMQLAKKKIRVNGVAPGPIWTPLIPSTFPPEAVEKFGQDVPMKRADSRMKSPPATSSWHPNWTRPTCLARSSTRTVAMLSMGNSQPRRSQAARETTAHTRHMRRIARDDFGFEQLRPEQEQAIHALLEGCDTLAVMPTGSGKSAIYQIAGMMLPGPTVVVSPLIALQQDQVEKLDHLDLASSQINSTMGVVRRREAFQRLAERSLKFLLMAPEQFANEETLEKLRAARPSLFVIDEAHCISQWGDDFRPEYHRLGAVIESLGHPVVLALTATASPLVRDDIVEQLGMRTPHLLVQGFDRPNIWLGVESFHEESVKRQQLLERVRQAAKPGIVYVATRKHAEELATELEQEGVRAAPYHAGMKPAEREATQQAFMADELEVIVATIAFGLGVDKPNVRFVYHYDISDSVDAYYQEIGRAGRDGEPATAILFYRSEDLALHQFFAGGGQVDAEQVEQVVEMVQGHQGPIDTQELQEHTDLSQAKVITAVSRLEEIGAVKTLPGGEVADLALPAELGELAEQAIDVEKHHRQADRSRIEMMHDYAELGNCQRGYLLNYFGEMHDGQCGHCDNCDAGIVAEQVDEHPYAMHSRVKHASLGEGQVQRYDEDKMVVLFDDVGYKTLLVDFVVESGALQAVD